MKTNSKKRYPLRIRFALGALTLIAGLMGGAIALFQWIERAGTYHLYGEYTRYVLGFGSFVAMIFGATLINDSWILWRLSNREHELLKYVTHQKQMADFDQQGGSQINRDEKSP